MSAFDPKRTSAVEPRNGRALQAPVLAVALLVCNGVAHCFLDIALPPLPLGHFQPQITQFSLPSFALDLHLSRQVLLRFCSATIAASTLAAAALADSC